MEAAIVPPMGMYMDPANLRLAANDPGTKNNALCAINLIGVSHVIGVDGPRTRTPIPRFLILNWGLMDLEVRVGAEPGEPGVDPAAGRLHELQRLMTHEQKLGAAMPTWRRNLARQMHSNWAVLFERYLCSMTGRHELPVLAGENQLDIDADARHKEAIDTLTRHREVLRAWLAALPPNTVFTGEQLEAFDYVINFKHLTVRNENEFSAARMYTLSQVLSGVVEALDQERDLGEAWRLVINAAKKHAIASDRSLTYYMRKKRAVAHARWLLERQRDAPDITQAERDNGARWLRWLDEREAINPKLDDLADAFLLALETAMRIHKKWYKKVVARDGVTAMPLCYRPVTNADIEAARTAGTLAINTPLNEPAPIPRKYARKRKAPALAPGVEEGPGVPVLPDVEVAPEPLRKKRRIEVHARDPPRAAVNTHYSSDEIEDSSEDTVDLLTTAVTKKRSAPKHRRKNNKD